MKILVTSAHWKSALTVMQSLGRAGHEIAMVSSDPYQPSLYSKFCRRKVISPNEDLREDYCRFLLQHLSVNQYDLLIPISDLVNEYLSDIRQEVARYVKMLLPSRENLDLARDKIKTYRFAQENGILIPETFFPETMAEVDRLKSQLTYPCMVKQGKGTGGSGNMLARSPDELLMIFQDLPKPWPVIQQFIVGELNGLTAVCLEGEILASFSFLAFRQYPDSGGITVNARSIRNERIIRESRLFLSKLSWTGVVDFDYLIGTDGSVFLLEINPRFSGTIQFAYKCGVDLPRVFLDVVSGKAPSPIPIRYRAGILYRSIFSEEILSCAKNKKYVPAFFLNFFRWGVKYDFYWDDPRMLWWQLKKARWDWEAILRWEKTQGQGSPG
jgi:predicted ATP-grasp superfamily ATP-dependent carboligase